MMMTMMMMVMMMMVMIMMTLMMMTMMMTLVPMGSAWKLLLAIPTIDRRISGAVLGPNDIRTRFATAPFQTGTSTFSSWPSGPVIVISFLVEEMESMEHMKMSATMKTATKL